MLDYEAKAKLSALKTELDVIRKAELEYVEATYQTDSMRIAHISRLQQMEQIVARLAALTKRKPE